MTTALWLSKRFISSTTTARSHLSATAKNLVRANTTLPTHTSLRNLQSRGISTSHSVSTLPSTSATSVNKSSSPRLTIGTTTTNMCGSSPYHAQRQSPFAGQRRNMMTSSTVLGLVLLVLSVLWGRSSSSTSFGSGEMSTGDGTKLGSSWVRNLVPGMSTWSTGNVSGSAGPSTQPSSSTGSTSNLDPSGITRTSLILPPTETRPHRLLTLPNKLECIIISDPEADKSASALDVGVGHLEDPANLPGCAHFCEHLMFLGTKTFPQENAYNTYLTSHNGHSNAYTDLCNTNYYFEVAPNALLGALDRFAGFFSEPLFAEDCTEREANAVNSEHKKNLQSDMWRFYQLEKHLSSPSHPYNKFGTGSLETLWSTPKSQDRDPRAELIEWWKKEYCSSRMKLVVLGKENLDVLEGWVRERFEKVPYKGKEKVMYSDKVFEEGQMGHIVFVEPVKDTRGMEITFPFPDQRHFYKSKPASYLAHFLGHEGPGSILSYLKRRGWVNSLRAGAQNGSSGFELFKVTVDLTEDGLVNYEKVAQAVYKYIHLLKSQPPSEETFNEIKALAEIGFRFVERGGASSYVSDLARQLHQPVPREKIISSQWLVEEFDADETRRSLELLDPRRSNIAVSARSLPPSVQGTFDLTEPIYETKYKRIKMSQAFIDEALNGTLPELHLPGKNAFIPENLDVEKIDVDKPTVVPELIKDTELSKLWYKKDDRFWIPRANVFLSLRTPLLQVSPRNTVLARLFVDLFRDSIAEETYDAELAGLQFSLDYAGDSLTVGTVGYNDKLPAMTEKMLGLMRSFKVDESRFELIRDQLRRSWQNMKMEEPYQLVSYYAHYAESEFMWTMQEKVAELEFCTPEAVDAFSREMFERLYIEGLIHGNMDKENALALQSMVESVLKPRALTASEKVGERSMLLPEGSAHVWNIDVANPSEVNSAIEYYCEVGDIQDDILRPQLSLLASLVSEPAFNMLRTKEQLGYIVFALPRASTGTMGLRILIQSEKDSVYLETRIEAFLDHMKEFLDNLSEEEYEKHKAGVIHKKLEKPKNLHGESARFWTAVEDGYYDFERRFRDAEYTKSIAKQDITDLFMSRIHYNSPIRKKLSIHMRSTYQGVKFDPARATPIIQAFMAKQVPVSQEDLGALLATSPGLPEIQKFARDCLVQATHLSEEEKATLDKQIADLDTAKVAVGEREAKLRKENVVIDDIVHFKAGLRPSRAPVPLRKFSVV